MADFPPNDCGECNRLKTCRTTIALKNLPTILISILCDLYDLVFNLEITGGGGAGGAAVSKVNGAGTLSFAGPNTLVLDVEDYASAAMEFSGTFAGEATFEGSLDGTNYNETPLWGQDISGNPVSTISEPGTVFFNVGIFNTIRARVTTVGSGTATVRHARSTVPL